MLREQPEPTSQHAVYQLRTRPGSDLDRHSVPLQCGAKLVSRGELQFAEDAGEVALNRACGDEQRLRDLAVSEAVAGVLGDPALAGCQRVEPCEKDPARA